MRAFVAWHRERHQADLRLIGGYFDAAAFEAEVAGCVALKAIDATSCEMKRMFVDPHSQGRGVGQALAQAVISEARAARKNL